jgi:hypothetical protein
MASNSLLIPSYNVTKFTWNNDVSIGCADRSDFPGQLCSRVWNDSCDVGFHLISAKSNLSTVMFLTRQEGDDEGDIHIWVFEGTHPLHPDKTLTIKVFND